jgi:hypothetical protein
MQISAQAIMYVKGYCGYDCMYHASFEWEVLSSGLCLRHADKRWSYKTQVTWY